MSRLIRWSISLAVIVAIAGSGPGCGGSSSGDQHIAKTIVLPKKAKDARKGFKYRQPTSPTEQ
jgi:hypothetical protein